MFPPGCCPKSNTKGSSGASSDVSLSAWTIDGNPASEGATTNLNNGVTTSSFAVTLPDPNASIDDGTMTGDVSNFTDLGGGSYTWDFINLAVGDNNVAFIVTAEDAVTTEDYTQNLHQLNTGVKERTEIANTQEGTFFATAGAGKSLVVNDTQRRGYWFNTGTEAEPDLSGLGVTAYSEVVINTSDTASAISDALRTVMGAFLTEISTGATFVMENTAVGPQTSPDGNDSGMTVSVIVLGENPS